ncbi:hypothetical protein ThesuDRAFT_00327 [Thermaerobacter subterraneus DSM 13965]|uniref:Uncharacterized protein n=1 Tax=Thermaerobacter subterraneus DSM 13965 TaxID=867903 RepID=K6NXY6_9FIRM|nr:hypothetical protein ThesuDRAFT_00327 [Thermaerobacter subterraneus DSM 13965]
MARHPAGLPPNSLGREGMPMAVRVIVVRLPGLLGRIFRRGRRGNA